MNAAAGDPKPSIVQNLRWTPYSIANVVCGVALVIGVLLPWVTIDVGGLLAAGGVGGTSNGFGTLFGVLLFLLGLGLIGLGTANALGQWPIVVPVTLVVAVIAAVLSMIQLMGSLSDLGTIERLTGPDSASLGMGLYVTVLASLAALVVSLLPLIASRRKAKSS